MQALDPSEVREGLKGAADYNIQDLIDENALDLPEDTLPEPEETKANPEEPEITE